MRRADRADISPRQGRPRCVELDAGTAERLAKMMLSANVGRGAVSATMAARVLAGEEPELAEALARRASKHSLPAAVVEVARRVRPLAAAARDPRKIRDAAGARGFLRMAEGGRRRLLAGERFSLDDITANTACCVPWPRGGDRCADNYGVRVGRWQTLAAHCHGSSMVPLYISQIRFAQSYRGEDAAALVAALARTVATPRHLVLEGGVWQGPRVADLLEATGIGRLDAKGRPQQKLVENWIQRWHTRMAVEVPGAQMGRFRGEELERNELYIACRAGRRDPRKHFPMLSDLLEATDRCIAWINGEPIESRDYGTWVPEVRWAEDLAAHPRPPLDEAAVPAWVTAPVIELRTVLRCMVGATAAGPDGAPVKYWFAAPELRDHERRRVRVAFDPATAATEGAEIVEADAAKRICRAPCVSAAAGCDLFGAKQATDRVRDMMRREIRVLLPDPATGKTVLARRESLVRLHGTADATAAQGRGTGPEPATERAWREDAPRAVRATGGSRTAGRDLSGFDPSSLLAEGDGYGAAEDGAGRFMADLADLADLLVDLP